MYRNDPPDVVDELEYMLDATGLDADHLEDFVDRDALDRFIISLDGEFEISFSVKHIQATITEEGVLSTSVAERI